MLILILDFREIFNYIYWLIVLVLLLYRVLILMEFGYRHRAFRSNLLSKKRSKGFLLQSLTQNHLLIVSFMDIGRLQISSQLVVKDRPIVHAPLTNPQRTNTAHCITYYANIILHIMPASYLICSLRLQLLRIAIHCPVAHCPVCQLLLVHSSKQRLLNLHVLYNLLYRFL